MVNSTENEKGSIKGRTTYTIQGDVHLLGEKSILENLGEGVHWHYGVIRGANFASPVWGPKVGRKRLV